MPTSWGEKDNPFKGWLSIRYHGTETKDLCPECVHAKFSQQLISVLQYLYPE